MKKLYLLGLLLVTASITGCTLQAPTITEVSTGAELTWTELTGTQFTGAEHTGVVVSSAMQEFTWEIDSWTVPMVAGSEWIHANTGVTAEAKALIEKRKTQSGDETKLTEEDIGLMEQIIQKIQKIWK